MRILHLIDSGGLYGAEVMLLTLIREQMTRGLHVVLGSIGELDQPEKPLEQAARRLGVKLQVFRMKSGYNLAGMRQILRYVRAEGIELVHGHGYKANVLIGALPRFIRGVPYVGTLHGWTSGGQMSAVRLYETVEKLALRRLDAVVAVSSAMRGIKDVARLPESKVRVINNGIDPDGHAAAAPDRDDEIARFCAAGFTVGILGRLAPEKGHRTLIEAVHSLRAAGRDIRLLILGDGRLRAELEALVDERGLRPSVLFAGYRQDAAIYLPLLKVCALPSFREGLPIVLLEAMRASVPIVASRVGGIPEAVSGGRSALLVEPGESAGLADAIARLHGDPQFALGLAASARRDLEQKYSSSVMAREYEAVYAHLLGRQ